jgi:hypothetical protein
MNHPPLSPCPYLSPHLYPSQHLFLSPHPYLYLYRYQVLIGKDPRKRRVGDHHDKSGRDAMPLRPRQKGRDTTKCAYAQVAGGYAEAIPRLLIPGNGSVR